MWSLLVTTLLLIGWGFADLLIPQEIPNTFCEIRDSGVYGLGCSPYFVICKGGTPKQRKCTSALYFDEIALSCLPKVQVQACMVENLPPPKETFQLAPKVIPKAFTCIGKIDGIYKQQCSSLFVVCNRQEATFLMCPHGLIYDGTTAKCQKKVNGCDIKAVKKVQPLMKKPVTAFSCKATANGYYAQVAVGFVIKCLNGKSTLLHCPKGLALNPQENFCVKNSLKRSKRFIEYSFPALPDALLMDGFLDTPSAVIGLPSPLTYFPTCAGLTYGVHAFGCSANYVVALPEYCSLFTCPIGLVFDTVLEHCAPNVEVLACSVKTVVETSTSTATTAISLATKVAMLPITVTTTVPPAPRLVDPTITFDCSNKPDGPYSLGCSHVFAMCTNGDTKFLICAADLKYDSISVRCLEEAFVAECGGTSTPIPPVVTSAPVLAKANLSPTITSPVIIPVTTASPKVAAAVGTPVVIAACTDKADGVYSLGCMSNFYSCVAGVPLMMECPNELVFDDFSGGCLAKVFVGSCGALTTTPIAVKRTSCSGYSGVISKGCQKYAVCLGNVVKEFFCPSAYMFSIGLHACIPQTYRNRCA